jgi:hypothetical protein
MILADKDSHLSELLTHGKNMHRNADSYRVLSEIVTPS